MEGYAKYIALRPRGERLGEHGLFGDDDDVDLSRVMDELDHYTGNVWAHIISLHREDAERLGYGRMEHSIPATSTPIPARSARKNSRC